MLIKLGMDAVYGIFYLLISGLTAFNLPSGVTTVLSDLYSYLDMGASYFAAFTHFQYLCGLLSAVLVLNSIIFMYQAIMWILKKVPFLGVSE